MEILLHGLRHAERNLCGHRRRTRLAPRRFLQLEHFFEHRVGRYEYPFRITLAWQSQQGAYVPIGPNPAIYPGGVNSAANAFNFTEIVYLPDLLVGLIRIQIQLLNDTVRGEEFGQQLYQTIKNDTNAIADLLGVYSGGVDITFPYPPPPPSGGEDDNLQQHQRLVVIRR